MKTARRVLMCVIAFMVASCATVQYAERPAEFKTKPNKGMVFFYREKSMIGAAIRYQVSENGMPLGTLANGTFFVIDADPGDHLYLAKTESDAQVVLTVKAGNSYYVKGGIKMGAVMGRPSLTQMDESVARGKIASLKFTAPAQL